MNFKDMDFTEKGILHNPDTIKVITDMGMSEYGDRLGRVVHAAVNDNDMLSELSDGRKFKFNDAPMSGVAFLTHQLAYMMAGTQLVQYPELKFRQLVSINSNYPRVAESINWKKLDHQGMASFDVDLSTDDVPMTGVAIGQDLARIYAGTIGYAFSDDELEKALATGLNLDSEKVFAARLGYERRMNEVVLKGNAGAKIKGLFNQTAAVVAPITSPLQWFDETTSGLFAGTGIGDIREGFNKLFKTIFDRTGQTIYPDTLALPPSIYDYLAGTYTGINGDKSLLDLFANNNIASKNNGKPLNIISVRELEDAGSIANSQGKKYRIAAYNNSVSNLFVANPIPLEFLAPQRNNFKIKVVGRYSMSSLVVKRSECMGYMDGM